MTKARVRRPGTEHTISATDEEWVDVRSGAAQARMSVSAWAVHCALTVSKTRGCLMRAKSAGLRVATTKASSSQCFQRVRETPIMRPSAAPAFSGSPGGETPVSRQVQTQKSRNYNDLQWSGTMNNNSCARSRR